MFTPQIQTEPAQRPRSFSLNCAAWLSALLVGLLLGCSGNHRTETTAVEEKVAADSKTKTFMWQASSPERPEQVVHLVGSIHVGNASFYPLPGPIDQAFAEASTLVVELDPTDQMKMAQALLQVGVLPVGRSLKNEIPPELWTSVATYAAEHGLPVEVLLRFKPWVVALQLLSLQMMDIGLDPKLGVEAHFIGRAQNGMQIVSLETAQYQLGIFNNLPPDLQLLLLRDAVEGLSQPNAQEMIDLTEMWARGDTQGVASLLTRYLSESPEFQPLFNELFTKRNETMTARIAELHKTHNAMFVVIGAGHLVGQGGIVERLTKMGWIVEQVSGS